MSDCTRGGRIAYEKPGGQRSFSSSKKTGEENEVLELRVDFEGETTPWTYPLALNGRTVEKVTVGGVEYGPQEDYFETVFADGGLQIEAVVMGGARYERVRECELRKAHWDDGTSMWGVICTACGHKHGYESGTCWEHCPACGARVTRGSES